MIIVKIFLLFGLFIFALANDISNETYIVNHNNITISTSNFTIKPYSFNLSDEEIKYINYMNSAEVRKTRLCDLFKIFFDKPYYIDFNNELFIQAFSIIYENPFVTQDDIQFYYIKNNCYDKVYQSNTLSNTLLYNAVNNTEIGNIFLISLFMFCILHIFKC